MDGRIPISFLQQATAVLADTNQGLSGPEIVQVCNDWAVKEAVDTPHASYPFTAWNKKTALLENLQVFEPAIQFKILRELCTHHRLQDNPNVRILHTQLLERFASQFNLPPIFSPEPVAPDLSGMPDQLDASDFQIFLCHANADKSRVRKLYTWLKNSGYKPWFDEKDLLPGQDWQHEISLAVRASKIVMVCLSRRSITQAGYVQKEIKIALDIADEQPEGTIFIVPARLENCDVPSRLAKFQWVNLFEADGYAKLLKAFEVRISGYA